MSVRPSVMFSALFTSLIILTFNPGDLWMGAACWQTAESDWIPLQQDMISQFNVEHWCEICEERRTDEWRQVHMMHEIDPIISVA